MSAPRAFVDEISAWQPRGEQRPAQGLIVSSRQGDIARGARTAVLLALKRARYRRKISPEGRAALAEMDRIVGA